MANLVTNKAKFDIMKNDLSAVTLKVMLLTSSYTPAATHNFVSDCVANELSGAGYARKTLASVTITEDDTNGVAYLDAADVTWTAINAGTAKYIALFRSTGVDSTSPLYGVIDITSLVTNGSDVTITWPATGILQLG